MDFTLNTQLFPNGTTVRVHSARGYTAAPSKPPGSSVASATASAGKVSFTGLTKHTPYFAYGEVSGEWRVVAFIPGEDAHAEVPKDINYDALAAGLPLIVNEEGDGYEFGTVGESALPNSVGRGIAELHSGFAGLGTVALPEKADSGQLWIPSSAGTGGAYTVVNGTLTNTGSSGTVASYLQAKLAGQVVRLAGDLAFDKEPNPSTNGSAGLHLFPEALKGTIPDTDCHCSYNQAEFIYSIWRSGVEIPLKTQKWASGFTWAENVFKRIQVVVGDGYAIVFGPDGLEYPVEDSRVGEHPSEYACFELFQNNAATNGKGSWLNVAADIGLTGPQSRPATFHDIGYALAKTREAIPNITAPNLRELSGDTTLANGDYALVDASGGEHNINLPVPTTIEAGAMVWVKKTDTSSHPIIVSATGEAKVDGAATFPLKYYGRAAGFVFDGTNWKSVIDTDIRRLSHPLTPPKTEILAAGSFNYLALAASQANTLPTASPGASLEFLRTDVTEFVWTIAAPEGVTIDGASSITIPGNSYLRLWCDGTNWHSASRGGPEPIRSGAIIGRKQYAPTELTALTVTGTTFTAVDKTNLTVSFVAPPSGKVLVSLEAVQAATEGTTNWALLDHTAETLVGSTSRVGSTGLFRERFEQEITGLTAGKTYQYDWAAANGTAGKVANLYAQKGSSTTVPIAAGPAIMKVVAV